MDAPPARAGKKRQRAAATTAAGASVTMASSDGDAAPSDDDDAIVSGAGAAAPPAAAAADKGDGNGTGPATPTALTVGGAAAPPGPAAISFFERWLSCWVVLCMVVGALIGFYAQAVPAALERAQFANINAIVAVLLWIMITPMLVAIDFQALWAVRREPGAIMLTTIVNYCVKPFSGFALALLFLKVFYVRVIPDSDLRNSYIAGIVLLCGAPCTAMVFVWSLLVGGNGAYTLVQVAFNDLLMLALYVPICAALIGATNLTMPWDTIAIAVALFIAAPLALAATIRAVVLRRPNGKRELEVAMDVFKPLTIVALLATLLLIFIFQGKSIGTKPLDIVLLCFPITIQVVLNFCLTYGVGYWMCLPHDRLAPASLIATSNFFEMSVAAAISIYGLDSGAALATVVGVLVEVPLMLALVSVCTWLRPALEARIALRRAQLGDGALAKAGGGATGKTADAI